MIGAVIGIDCGLSGGISCYDGARMTVLPMPVMEKARVGKKALRVIDENGLLATMKLLADAGATVAYVEAVGGIPGQSGPASFNFGHGYGAVRMACLAAGLRLEPIASSVWKPAMRAPKDKKGARYRASELLPASASCWTKVNQDGLAESAMIALYGWKQQ